MRVIYRDLGGEFDDPVSHRQLLRGVPFVVVVCNGVEQEVEGVVPDDVVVVVIDERQLVAPEGTVGQLLDGL